MENPIQKINDFLKQFLTMPYINAVLQKSKYFPLPDSILAEKH